MSSFVGQFIYNVPGIDNTVSLDDLINNNLVSKISPAAKIIKLGIQAEPGITAVINDGVNIVIGRNGMYELDNENIIITSLRFIPKPLWVKDEEQIKVAEQEAVTAFAQIQNSPYVYPPGEEDLTKMEWNSEEMKKWVEEYQNTNLKFQDGYSAYLKAYYGVYVKDSEYQDFHNLIIDYVAEVEG